MDNSSSDAGTPSGNGELTLVTKEGLKNLKEELQLLKTTRRREVAQRLKEAISYGDLSENSEWEEAKNEQAFTEGRISELEQKIKNAKLIAEGAHGKHGREVNVGSSVTIRNITADDAPETYTIVGATEADPFSQKISNESPIGKAILLKCCGDTVLVCTPAGTAHYEILKVS